MGNISNQSDIVLNIRLELQALKQSLAEAQNAIKQKMAKIKQEMQSIQFTKGGTFRINISDKDQDRLERLTVQYRKLAAEAQRAAASGQAQILQKNKELQKQTGILQRLQIQAKKTRMEFQGWALSIMFFGMALKRIFDTVWKSSTKTFNDVIHSVEGATTGFDMLDGSMKFLGFTVGQALEPIAYFLFPIIEKMAYWVTENEKLVAGVLLAAGVFGTLFIVIGQASLALFGFLDVGLKIGTLLSSPGSGSGIMAFLSALSAPAVVGALAALAAVFIIWKNDIGGVQENLAGLFELFGLQAKNIYEDIKGLFSGLFDIVEGLFTGDAEQVFKGFLKLMESSKLLSIDILLGIGVAFVNMWATAINLVKDLFINLAHFLADTIIGAMEWAVKKYNELAIKMNMATIDFDFEAAKAGGDKFIEDFKNGLDVPLVTLDQFKEARERLRAIALGEEYKNYTPAPADMLFSQDPSILRRDPDIGGNVGMTFVVNNYGVISKEKQLEEMMEPMFLRILNSSD